MGGLALRGVAAVEVPPAQGRVQNGTLEGHKSMMVDENVDIEEIESIKCGVHCDGTGDKIWTPGYGHEMDSMKDTVHMDDCKVWAIVITYIWFNNPVACIFIGFSAHEGKPLDKCAGVLLASM
jgi:hypothetical protein